MKKFEIGMVKISLAASKFLSANNLKLATYLEKYQSGEWGESGSELSQQNKWAIKHKGTIRSMFNLPKNEILFINTDNDRTITWVMLKAEYEGRGREVSTQEGYALWAKSYDREINPLIAVEEPHVEMILDKVKATKVLDAGTGTGRYARKLTNRGFDVVAIDQSPEMLEKAQFRANEERLKINFQLGSLEALPFETNHFDLVVCGLVLCHISNLEQVIKEFSRVSKGDGNLLITDLHPAAVEMGGRTVFLQADAWYLLPNINHTLQDYLKAVDAAGYSQKNVIDLYLRDMPDDVMPYYEEWVNEKGDDLFSLIIYASKGLG